MALSDSKIEMFPALLQANFKCSGAGKLPVFEVDGAIVPTVSTEVNGQRQAVTLSKVCLIVNQP